MGDEKALKSILQPPARAQLERPKMAATNTIIRDIYGAITLESLSTLTRKTIENLVKKASPAKHADEHGTWEFGCDWGKYDARAHDDGWTDRYKPAGWSLNWSLYGYGRDAHSGRMIAIIQVRQSVRKYRCWHLQQRKSYFLIGKNEDGTGTTFAHPVGAQAVRNAARKKVNVVLAVQNWIFGGHDYKKLVRQGDVALLKKAPRGKRGAYTPNARFLLAESHELRADTIYIQGEKMYALNPSVQHCTHADITGNGWHLVIVGRRASAWDFAPSTIEKNSGHSV